MKREESVKGAMQCTVGCRAFTPAFIAVVISGQCFAVVAMDYFSVIFHLYGDSFPLYTSLNSGTEMVFMARET